MESYIKGMHHVTAIAGDAKRNLHFYTEVLGLRLIKKTVNFDDPHTYHFYFANANADLGSVLTFFPWGDRVKRGLKGAGMATEVSYSVPKGSLDFWVKRLDDNNVFYSKPSVKFGERYIAFLDPDGLKVELIETDIPQDTLPEVYGVKPEYALNSIYAVTLTLNNIAPTASILTDVFGYELEKKEGNRTRYTITKDGLTSKVDLVELPNESRGIVAGGIIHHVAFRVSNDGDLMKMREKIVALGLNITEQIDRQYFHSLYFREPGGVLFEIATDNPGFDIDEDESELGQHLMLPSRYEGQRERIEKALPVLA